MGKKTHHADILKKINSHVYEKFKKNLPVSNQCLVTR